MALQEDRNIRRITIVGGGTSGYLTAFHLAQTYPDKHITWYFPEENDPIGVGEALVPEVSHFLKNLGVTHNDIVTKVNGSLKIGIKFENWNGNDDEFFFPFGIAEEHVKYNSSSLNLMAKFNSVPDNVLEYPDISVHFRTSELLTYLDQFLTKYENLTIVRERVTLDTLPKDYDLLIDSTGFKRVVSMQPDNYKSIADIIPNNRALVYRHVYTDEATQSVPYSSFTAKDHGWIWHIPLRNQLAMGYVHDGKYDVRDEFVQHIEKRLNIKVDPAKIDTINFTSGRNKVHLKDNVVAIGLASCFIEPLESTGLYLTTTAVNKICKYINGEITEQEYNDSTNEFFDRLTNFIAGHYKFSKRTGEYWDHFRNLDIQLYLPLEIFPEISWNFILSGFLDDVEYPKYPVDTKELIRIRKGTPYHEWVKNDDNFK